MRIVGVSSLIILMLAPLVFSGTTSMSVNPYIDSNGIVQAGAWFKYNVSCIWEDGTSDVFIYNFTVVSVNDTHIVYNGSWRSLARNTSLSATVTRENNVGWTGFWMHPYVYRDHLASINGSSSTILINYIDNTTLNMTTITVSCGKTIIIDLYIETDRNHIVKYLYCERKYMNSTRSTDEKIREAILVALWSPSLNQTITCENDSLVSLIPLLVISMSGIAIIIVAARKFNAK